jgi:hypothetical protein
MRALGNDQNGSHGCGTECPGQPIPITSKEADRPAPSRSGSDSRPLVHACRRGDSRCQFCNRRGHEAVEYRDNDEFVQDAYPRLAADMPEHIGSVPGGPPLKMATRILPPAAGHTTPTDRPRPAMDQRLKFLRNSCTCPEAFRRSPLWLYSKASEDCSASTLDIWGVSALSKVSL